MTKVEENVSVSVTILDRVPVKTVLISTMKFNLGNIA
jgi:hypothetical protein